MIKTIEATIDANGVVHLTEPVMLKTAKRALVTILDEKPTPTINKEALLSERALAKDWESPEEEEAWKHLQSDR